MSRKRLLIQMFFDASTNKYPMSFPIPMLLLNIKEDGDDLLDLVLEGREMVNEQKLQRIDEIANLINNNTKGYDEFIINMGEYPADADKFNYFEYFLNLINVPISVMGPYTHIFKERVEKFNGFLRGNNIKILKTDYDVRETYIPDEILDTYPMIGKKKRATMKLTWGCPQHCKMCPVPAIYNGKYRYDRPEVAVKRIVDMYNRGVRFITFTDDNLSASDRRFVTIFNEIEKLELKGLRFHSQEGFEVTAFKNEEFCKIVAKSTWEQVKLGVENIKVDFLQQIGKYYFDPSDIDIALKNIKKYNVKDVRFFYLLGLNETEEDVMDNLRYFSKHHVQLRSNVLRKYLGTEMNDMVLGVNMTEPQMRKLKALSYAISWLSSYKIDLFEKDSFDKFCSQNGYSVEETDGVVTIKGRTKFGFQSGRFRLALKYMYENQHGVTDMVVNNDVDGIVTLSKKEIDSENESKWFKE